MLTKLGWSSLAEQRNEHRLIMLYKVIHHWLISMLIPYFHLAPVITLPVATPTGSCSYQQELMLMKTPFSQVASPNRSALLI